MRTLLFFLSSVLIASASLVAQQDSLVEVPAGAKLILQAQGVGNQIYNCTDHKWELKAPDAKLMDIEGTVIGSHFEGPTWQLNDGSEVKGKLLESHPSPDPMSVPWLLLEAVPGSGKGKFAAVAYIRRTVTQGGGASKESCESGETRVPYTATYTFYEKSQ